MKINLIAVLILLFSQLSSAGTLIIKPYQGFESNHSVIDVTYIESEGISIPINFSVEKLPKTKEQFKWAISAKNSFEILSKELYDITALIPFAISSHITYAMDISPLAQTITSVIVYGGSIIILHKIPALNKLKNKFTKMSQEAAIKVAYFKAAFMGEESQIEIYDEVANKLDFKTKN